MAILGSLSQIVLMVSVDIKQHWAWISHTIPIFMFVTQLYCCSLCQWQIARSVFLMFVTQLYFCSLCQWQIARSVFLTENRHTVLNLTLQLTWSNSGVGRNDNLFANLGWLTYIFVFSLIRSKVCAYWLPSTVKILPSAGPLLQRHLEEAMRVVGDHSQHSRFLFAWIAVCKVIRTVGGLDLMMLVCSL